MVISQRCEGVVVWGSVRHEGGGGGGGGRGVGRASDREKEGRRGRRRKVRGREGGVL